MSDYYIGENVRMLRKAAGLSQAKLAEKMREAGRATWWQNTVSRVEKNSQPVEDMEDLEALGDILDGNLLKGTPLGGMFKEWSDKVVLANVERRLLSAQEALNAAQQDLDLVAKLVESQRKKMKRNGLDQET